ncbi:hypothetical protein BKA64DRAFT_648901 [Cadophora sp. MPI-SDFR-AT-0126]|nr:hypothetical protein BKA64DRAFT_648901 [Leotiomycetes sp. MPI-SDFR-AT-0126]
MSCIFAALLVSALLLPAAQARSNCCSVLSSQLPGNVFWPNDPLYVQEAESSFWYSVNLVSDAVKLLERGDCKFSVRGGGHMPNRGAANIDDGILIAMTKLDELSFQEDYVSVGAGLRWGPVFDFLATRGLAVVGGRVGIVGVPGLILGCGLSTFSGNRGFACDNVKQIQIVTAGGRVVDASQDSNSDLFWALKGGSNNFGIVTRFDLYTYSDSNIYTALQSLEMKHWDEVAAAINNFITLSSEDSIADKMAIAPKLQWVVNQTPEILLPLTSTLLPAPNDGWSNKKGPGLVLPPGLVDFADLPFTKNASTGMYTTTISENLKKISIASGLRYELRVMSFRSSVEILIALRKVFEEEFASVFADVLGFSGVMEIQPITKRNIRQGYARGGNALGAVLTNSWLNAADDELAFAAGQRVVDRMQALAREQGLYDSFLFLNDAGVGQNPIATYGNNSISKLNQVKQKYDEMGTFERLLPGGFKIPKV